MAVLAAVVALGLLALTLAVVVRTGRPADLLLAGVALVAWLLLDKPVEGPVLVELGVERGVTVADVVGLSAFLCGVVAVVGRGAAGRPGVGAEVSRPGRRSR